MMTPEQDSTYLRRAIELSWQDRWDAEGTFDAPNPFGTGWKREPRLVLAMKFVTPFG